MISETKLDESFPIGQFFFHLDRDRNGGDILFYIREHIPSKPLSIENRIELFFVKINLHQKKWLISCPYSPKKALIANHMAVLTKSIDIYTTKYDDLLFLGDFNARLEDASKKKCLFSL